MTPSIDRKVSENFTEWPHAERVAGDSFRNGVASGFRPAERTGIEPATGGWMASSDPRLRYHCVSIVPGATGCDAGGGAATPARDVLEALGVQLHVPALRRPACDGAARQRPGRLDGALVGARAEATRRSADYGRLTGARVRRAAARPRPPDRTRSSRHQRHSRRAARDAGRDRDRRSQPARRADRHLRHGTARCLHVCRALLPAVRHRRDLRTCDGREPRSHQHRTLARARARPASGIVDHRARMRGDRRRRAARTAPGLAGRPAHCGFCGFRHLPYCSDHWWSRRRRDPAAPAHPSSTGSPECIP